MKVLTVGAGPTTAALELCRQLIPTIIDRKSEPSHLNRAVGITARSLECWSKTGVDIRSLSRE